MAESDDQPEGSGDSNDSVAPDVRRLRQRALSDRLRESLLFLPVLILIGTIALEQLLSLIDRRWPLPEPSAVDLPPDAAVALLSTIAGAMITTAGVVFSLLVVSLQLASGQFSPRVLRTFWRDRFGQVLIGLLIATFGFCVMALTQIDTSADRAPALTMLGALALALGSIVAIVAYLNSLSRQQYVGRIMERIAEEALTLVRELPYGSHIGPLIGEPVPPPDPDTLGAPLVIRAHASGWVQQVSQRAVLGAVPPGSVVRLETRVGSFLITDNPLATIWPRPDPTTTRRLARSIGEAVIVGPSRTMQQDIDFGMRQLNDIGLRALSAAVNDPTTAVESILRVTSIMRPLLVADLPAQCVGDTAGRILLTPNDLDHAEYVRHAFGQVRRYAAPHPKVVLTLVRSLRMLSEACVLTGRRDAVLAELDTQLTATLTAARDAGLTEAELAPILAAAGRPPA